MHKQASAAVSAARDTRREGMLVGGTNKKKTVRYELDVTAEDTVVSIVTPVISLAHQSALLHPFVSHICSAHAANCCS